MAAYHPQHASVIAALIARCERSPQRTAFIYRVGNNEFKVSYAKLREDVILLSRAFQERKVTDGSKVFLLSDNRYAWMVTDLALMALGAVSIPRGSDTPTQELEYILSHAQCSFLVVETEALLERHQEMLRAHKEVKTIFIIEGVDRHRLFNNLYCYNDLLEDRTLSPADFSEFHALVASRRAEDLVTLIYTSGTTGNPKGVMLTHRNLLFNIEVLPPLVGLNETDRWVSILPSWHIFERTAEYLGLAVGSCIVYSNLKTFAADLENYRPTLVATVPRLWESLYGKVLAAVDARGHRARRLFDLLVGIAVRYHRARRRLAGQWPCFAAEGVLRAGWEKLLAAAQVVLLALPYRLACKRLAPLRDRFGGRLRVAISGGGTLPAYLEKWLDAIGIRIANAYGMTECAPAIAGRGLGCEVLGTLGPPVAGTELRIVDDHGRSLPPGSVGEIEVRGPQVFSGYYRNDEENRKAFTADGYFRTGDLGKLTLHGELVLTGRSKEIIVLASGENVDPSRIESAISQLPFVNDAVLVGQDRKGLAALIVPDWDKLWDYLAEVFGLEVRSREEFEQNPALRDRLKNEINRVLRPGNGFKPFEKLQRIDFLPEEFKVGDELTNTLKKRRHIIERKYRELIDRLFH